MNVIGLTLNSILAIIERLQTANFPEPVGSIEKCDLKKLESSLKIPFQRPTKSDSFEDFVEKAALLFFLITENHCFENSNKRIAVGALVTFADINGFNLGINEVSLYGLSIAITYLSKYGLNNEAVFEIEVVLRGHLVKKPGKKTSKLELRKLRKEFKDFMISRQV